MSQMTSLVKAEKALVKERVPVTTAEVRLINAHAPTGRGLSTRPAMVVRKIERSCHACIVTSTGLGIANRRMRPIATEITRGTNLAPCGGAESSGGGGGGEIGDSEAAGGLRAARGFEIDRRGLHRGEKSADITEGCGRERESRDLRWWRKVVEVAAA